MNTSRLFDVLRVLGAVLFAAGVGGAVIGGYAAVQPDADWCGRPTLAVFEPSEVSGSPVTDLPDGALVPTLEYESLSPAEREAIEKAVGSVSGEAEVVGSFPHQETFERGAIVPYEGVRYYVTVASLDDCVSVPGATLPLGLGVLGLGAVTYLVPTFAGRAVGRERSPRGTGTAVRDGSLAEPVLLAAFGGGVLLAVVHPLGAVVAGVAVGVTATSPSRAFVLGGYLGAVVVALFAVFAVLQLGWVPPTLPGLERWPAFVAEGLLAWAATVLARVVT